MSAERTTATAPLVGLADIEAAAVRLHGVIVRTPLLAYGRPDALWFLKAESLQPIGAFKIRGAYAAIAALPSTQRARGVVT